MSTRAQIRFATRETGVNFNEHPDAIHAQFYKHSDGYPEGLGLDIAKSLLDSTKLTNWDNKRVTNKQILDKIDALKVGEEGLNILATKIVSRMVRLKAMEEWFTHVSKSKFSWNATYEDLDLSEEYNALGEAAKLMTLLNLYQDDEEYEKCAIIKNRMDEVNKILKKYNK